MQTYRNSLLRRSGALFSVVTLVTLGCNRSNVPEMSLVRGRVLLDDKPLVGADVTFMKEGASRFSAGRTDEDGMFTLSTFEVGDGAIVGPNVVTVAMPAIADEPESSVSDSPLSGEYFELLSKSQAAIKKRELPTFYADPTQSGISVEVVRGKNDPTINLFSRSN